MFNISQLVSFEYRIGFHCHKSIAYGFENRSTTIVLHCRLLFNTTNNIENIEISRQINLFNESFLRYRRQNDKHCLDMSSIVVSSTCIDRTIISIVRVHGIVQAHLHRHNH
jgi:hypothetical protein